ncbi:hypothetical protein ES703_47657 [subsurface metagenome]
MNIFREAKQLLDKKGSGAQLTEEEQRLVSSAVTFAINLLPKIEPEYDELPVLENLEELAKIVEEQANGYEKPTGETK